MSFGLQEVMKDFADVDTIVAHIRKNNDPSRTCLKEQATKAGRSWETVGELVDADTVKYKSNGKYAQKALLEYKMTLTKATKKAQEQQAKKGAKKQEKTKQAPTKSAQGQSKKQRTKH